MAPARATVREGVSLPRGIPVQAFSKTCSPGVGEQTRRAGRRCNLYPNEVLGSGTGATCLIMPERVIREAGFWEKSGAVGSGAGFLKRVY